ncbi:WD40-repeat-containing domain protein [Paraphysoderma sedebokerense]|nr:WD40-repeat-containing domain protein [Paraphysoderma sedebokerense]KAI9140405.1 WD40-repeat-containing domain protein [Paraphysoderma sedebokerense]
MDENTRSFVYGLRHQARCIASVPDTERNTFLIGTLGLGGDNEIHLLDFDEDVSELNSIVYTHPNEVWSITACPGKPELFFTCYSVATPLKQEMRTALWKIPPEDFNTVRAGASAGNTSPSGKKGAPNLANPNIRKSNQKLTSNSQIEPILTLDSKGTDGMFRSVILDPNGELNKLVAIDNNKLHVYTLAQGLSKGVLGNTIEIPSSSSTNVSRIRSGAWNPHNSSSVGITFENDVHLYDIRSMAKSHHIPNAHSVLARCLDFNPNKQYQIVTGGDDCKIRFWDIRNPKDVVLELGGHSHWIQSVAYNHFHDQLLLSSSSDCQVNLTSIVSISSAPLGDEEDEEYGYPANSGSGDIDSERKRNKPTDGLVSTYDQHEDSVYSVAWSCADPWVFASLSYDGRAVVSLVPKEEKYKILL